MPSNRKNNGLHIERCSFCGMPGSDTRTLFAGLSENVYICTSCIEVCNEVMEEDRSYWLFDDADTDFEDYNIPSKKNAKYLKPKDIKKILDDYVIGQEEAKKTLSVAVYNHYKRVFKNDQNKNIAKSNVLLIGPTGVGKTLLAQTLAKALDVPFAVTDATTLTEAGYVGEDVENILLKLIQAADYDISRAERGIIYIDEIDKISRKSENPSITRDVSGEGVQQALLKIIEGTDANVPPHGGRKHPQQEFLKINTTNILFICGGAFVGMDKIVMKRVGNKVLGFEADLDDKKKIDEKNWSSQLNPHDLVKYGIIPELVGRLPVLTTLDELSEDDLVRVLKEPKDSIIKQYQHLFRLDGVELEFEDDALTEIAKTAKLQDTGARGLRGIIEKLLKDLMFEIPSDKSVKTVIITKDMVLGNSDAKIIKSTGSGNSKKKRKREKISEIPESKLNTSG